MPAFPLWQEAWRLRQAPVPSIETLWAVMASDHLSPPCLHRLADQLRMLSEVTETLTYRLLELEEKLAASEASHRLLREGQDPAVHEETETRLQFTEEKLARIESMLQMVERSGSTRHLLPVPAPVLQQEVIPLPHRHEPVGESEPFLDDEGEQSFMDELIA